MCYMKLAQNIRKNMKTILLLSTLLLAGCASGGVGHPSNGAGQAATDAANTATAAANAASNHIMHHTPPPPPPPPMF